LFLTWDGVVAHVETTRRSKSITKQPMLTWRWTAWSESHNAIIEKIRGTRYLLPLRRAATAQADSCSRAGIRQRGCQMKKRQPWGSDRAAWKRRIYARRVALVPKKRLQPRKSLGLRRNSASTKQQGAEGCAGTTAPMEELGIGSLLLSRGALSQK
jgi:hypothetical protein